MSSSSNAARATERPVQQRLVGGKYRIEGPLGKGGMATVWRARDVVANRTVALKLLTNGASATRRAFFEREFQVLAGLKHPHIVEVYDSGVDVDGLYYAMELLEGGDLSSLAPMSFRAASQIVCDVASALTLIHARRMLHRDLSHSNVRRTSGGHKLIDFGALSAFGDVSEIIGTAPFIAPEALLGRGLDQRTDLYSLGALAYWLLTGMHAFPVKQLSELNEAWSTRPKPASYRVRDLGRTDLEAVPPELDALIHALLSQDPAARPSSAVEVLQRLSSIAQLERGDQTYVVEAYFHSNAFVGRARERKLLRSALQNAEAAAGSCMLIEGAPGAGRTRLLTELAQDARFARALVLRAETQPNGELHSFALGMAHSLLDALPAEAREAATPFAPMLGHLSPRLRERLWGDRVPLALLPEAPGEARMRMQSALRDWFLTVRSQRPLVMIVDDVQLLDGGSAAWLASLAREGKSRKLLIVASLRDEASAPSFAVQALQQDALRVPLVPLTAAESLELTRSVFGDTPNLRRIATLIHERSGGNPAHAMELAEYLVRQGLAYYADGAWALPQDVAADALPSDRTQVHAARLARLPPTARALAQLLSPHDGLISLPLCQSLCELPSVAMFGALESLMYEGVLIGSEGGYRFTKQEVRQLLLRELDPEQRRRAHRVLGRELLERGGLSTIETLRTGLHLMLGGEIEHGSILVSRAVKRFATMEHADTALVGRELEQAVRLFREAGRPECELVPLLSATTQAGFYGERRLAGQYGEEAIGALQRTLKLPLAQRLRPYLGRKVSLIVALLYAGLVLRILGRNNPRVPSLQDTVRIMFGAACALAGMATLCIDPMNTARYAQAFEPLTALGKDHAATLLYDLCMNLSFTVQDRAEEARVRWKRFIERLESPKPIRDLPDYARVFYLGGALYASGVIECWRENPLALEIAERLEAMPLKLYGMSADQLRAFYHSIAGDLELYEQYRDKVEMHAIQRGTAWQVEIWAPAAMLTVHLRTLDAMRMKQSLDQLQHLYEDVPSLALYGTRARGAYRLLRGDARQALPLLEKVLAEQPLAVVGWGRQHGALARAYNMLGEHQKATDTCSRALSYLSEQDLTFTAMNLSVLVELALAEDGLGQHAAAAQRLDQLLERHGDKGVVTLGALHDARARVSASMEDATTFALHIGEMKRLYRSTKIPSLLEYCNQFEPEGPEHGRIRVSVENDAHASKFNTVIHRIEHGGGRSGTSASHWALTQLVELTAASEAYLFEPVGRDIRCTAHVGAQPAEELVQWAVRRVREYEEEESTVTRTTDLALPNLNLATFAGKTYRMRALMTSARRSVGAVVLPSDALIPPAVVVLALANRLARVAGEQPV
jgi:tetratricopeptide (TPR) repeat protein